MNAARTAQEWEDLFRQVPESFAAVMRAIFAEIEAEEAPRHRHHKAPARQRTIEDVYGVLYPQFSTEPFAVAIQPFLKPSLRAFAARSKINLSSLHRMVRGVEPLSLGKIEQIARAAKVAPAYFLEYRQLVITAAIEDQFRAHPAASVSAYKALTNGSRR